MKALAWQKRDVVLASHLKLEARHLPGARGAAVVAPPHPLYGGTMDNPVVIAIADGLARAGAAVLAFNWRGTEGSQGDKTDDLEAAVADYRGALAALGDASPRIAAGYSFGAGAALLAARDEPSLTGLVLLAPPVGLLRAEDLLATTAKIQLIVGDDDEYAPLAKLEPILAARPDVQLEVIRGADHFFHYGGMNEIAEAVSKCARGWLGG